MTAADALPVHCTVNGRSHDLEVAAGESLLHLLRHRLFLTGTKEGCLEGECGACTVLLDDLPVTACLVAAGAVEGRAVRTVEGLAGRHDLSPLQQAFIDQAAVQCGFCTPGFLMTLTALLEHSPFPSVAETRAALAGNICRCTGYRQIIDAVVAAAGKVSAAGGESA